MEEKHLQLSIGSLHDSSLLHVRASSFASCTVSIVW